jgi:hypothetical protein
MQLKVAPTNNKNATEAGSSLHCGWALIGGLRAQRICHSLYSLSQKVDAGILIPAVGSSNQKLPSPCEQDGEYGQLVCWMVVTGGTQISIGVSRLPVYMVCQRTIMSPVNMYIQEGNVAIFLTFCGELYFFVDTVEVQ